MIHTIIPCDESPQATYTGHVRSPASHSARGASRDLGPADNSKQHGQHNSNSDHENSVRSVFPLLMIHGVYRSSSAMGVRSYSFPAISKISSRYRLRKAVRAALQGFAAKLASSRSQAVQS